MSRPLLKSLRPAANKQTGTQLDSCILICKLNELNLEEGQGSFNYTVLSRQNPSLQQNQSLKPKYCSTDRQPYLSNAEEIKLSLQQSYNTTVSKKTSAGYYQLTASGKKTHISG